MIIRHGDCIAEMSALLDEGVRVDAVVTDPPAGISFMGKSWDGDKGGRNQWIHWMQEAATLALELAKPGAHALVWALPRTSHWTATAWEDAGWEVRDRVAHLFGTGFPKSLDVSKAIDKAAGSEREVIGTVKGKGGENLNTLSRTGGNDAAGAKGCGAYGQGAKQTTVDIPITAPATDAAKQWAGWGTALKPAVEDWWLLRKPLSEPTISANVLAHGTGALNIDASRVPTTDSLGGGRLNGPTDMSGTCGGPEWDRPWMHDDARRGEYAERTAGKVAKAEALGRWPANVLLEEGCVDEPWARYFYSAKASRQDRAGSSHPTVKPISLMRYLCRLVTPPGGLILDPFAGSGTTLEAAALEGFRCIGIEQSAEYVADIRRRLERTRADLGLFAAE